MKLIKFYIIIFSLILNISSSTQSISIFGENGYREKIFMYENAIQHSKNLLEKKDKNAIEILETAKDILKDIERHAANDIIGNAPLRAYLSHHDFLSKDLIYLTQQEEINAVLDLRKKIQEKNDEIYAYSLTISLFEPIIHEKSIPIKEPKSTKEIAIKELNDMRKPIEEYKKLVYTQKQIIFRYIDKIINDIETSSINELPIKKIDLIKKLYNTLFSINPEDPKANDKANEALTNFATEYNKIK